MWAWLLLKRTLATPSDHWLMIALKLARRCSMNDLVRRPWNAREPRRGNKLMFGHLRPYVSRCRRLPRAQWLPVGNDLLRNCDVRIGRRETVGAIQQTLRNADR